MKTITVTRQNGQKMTIEKETFTYLAACKSDYLADCAGMADAGMGLSSSFRQYVDFDRLRSFEEGTKALDGSDFDMAEYRFRRFSKWYEL